MLALSDTDIQQFLPTFAGTGVPVAFLVPTPTGMEKSIMDATGPVRQLLLNEQIHNYDTQLQGPANKILVETFLVGPDNLQRTETSLYRPVTKQGDPRIWIYKLGRYCSACNLLAIIVIDRKLYVFNLSNPEIASSLLEQGYCYHILERYSNTSNAVAAELLNKLREIHQRGFIPSITPGDPGVGDTLEHALGIDRNNSRDPDYHGIELKTTRLTRNGEARARTRNTLFTKVPDEGKTYREIIDAYGREQVPRGQTLARLQLYETFRCSRANAYDLILRVDSNSDKLIMEHVNNGQHDYVSAWYMRTLRDAILRKHPETFWIKAQSEMRDGREWFRYDKVLHTKNPNTSLIAPLLEADKITIDLAAHYKPDGSWRDHGILFKMNPEDLPLLLGNPIEYDLSQ